MIFIFQDHSRRHNEDDDDEIRRYLMPIYPSLKTTKYEALILVMFLRTKHNLTNEAVVDILKTINLILGTDSIPTSTYKLNKLLPRNVFQPAENYFCVKCSRYYDDESSSNSFCPNSDCDAKKTFSANNSFLTFRIAPQLEEIVKNNEKYLFKSFNKANSMIDDVTSGTIYTKLLNNGTISEGATLTLTINSDGA